MDKDGFWPDDCIQRAFVEGAKWWEFESTGFTMWQSDITDAEDEAVKRYGEPTEKIQKIMKDCEKGDK